MAISSNVYYSAAGLFAVTSVIVGILGLTGHLSLTAVSAVTILTSVINPVSFLVQSIIGILGLTSVLPMAAVAGVLIASQVIVLVAAKPTASYFIRKDTVQGRRY